MTYSTTPLRQTKEYHARATDWRLRQDIGEKHFQHLKTFDRSIAYLENRVPCGFDAEDADLLFDIKNTLRLYLELLDEQKYHPDQPRVPAGNAEGGQWTDAGGSVSAPRESGMSAGNQPPLSSKPRKPKDVANSVRSSNPNPMTPKAPRDLGMSPEGVEGIIGKENFKPEPYRVRDNQGRPSGKWTIGYGHEITKDDDIPSHGITAAQAEALLDHDLRIAEGAIHDKVTVPLTQPQFDVLVSYVYNAGRSNFIRSGILDPLNRGDYEGAANVLASKVYSYDADKKPEIKPGTPIRRLEEVEKFRSGIVK